MTEILFKAKRKDNGEWVSGGTIVQFLDNEIRSFYMPQFNEKCDCTHDDATDDILGFENCRFYKVNSDNICRYTGLTDRNGNLIWENDIVRYYDDLADMNKEDLVKWNETHASFTRLRKSQMGLQYLYINECIANRCEVIGNIFDNPELLEELE